MIPLWLSINLIIALIYWDLAYVTFQQCRAKPRIQVFRYTLLGTSPCMADQAP